MSRKNELERLTELERRKSEFDAARHAAWVAKEEAYAARKAAQAAKAAAWDAWEAWDAYAALKAARDAEAAAARGEK